MSARVLRPAGYPKGVARAAILHECPVHTLPRYDQVDRLVARTFRRRRHINGSRATRHRQRQMRRELSLGSDNVKSICQFVVLQTNCLFSSGYKHL
jgi:hypothetical protein